MINAFKDETFNMLTISNVETLTNGAFRHRLISLNEISPTENMSTNIDDKDISNAIDFLNTTDFSIVIDFSDAIDFSNAIDFSYAADFSNAIVHSDLNKNETNQISDNFPSN